MIKIACGTLLIVGPELKMAHVRRVG